MLGVNVRFTAKEVYAIMLDMTLHSEQVQTDKQGRRYAAISVDDIAGIIDRTPATVRNALNEVEGTGLVERMPTSYKAPARIYVKLPSGEDVK